MNSIKKTILLTQALWAKHTVRLAPEPPGRRSGVVLPSSPIAEAAAEPLRLVAVGDSLVAGSGVDNQSDALTPRIAQKIAEKTGRSVCWETYSKLGSTMRRIRYRFLPEVVGHVDILFVCAGTNDIMARRSRSEWIEEFTAVMAQAQALADYVIVCSAGQPHHSPKLPRMLRAELGKRVDAQTLDSQKICWELGIDYADVAHAELVPDFWASDGFHPGAPGYEQASGLVVNAMSFLPSLTATIH